MQQNNIAARKLILEHSAILFCCIKQPIIQQDGVGKGSEHYPMPPKVTLTYRYDLWPWWLNIGIM